MSYAQAWNEATPTSATVANTIAAYWTNNMIAIRERIDDIFGTSAASGIATADPYRPKVIKMTGQADSYIIGGSNSFGITETTGATYNFRVYNTGNIYHNAAQIIPGQTTVSFRDTTNAYDNLVILDNGAVSLRNALTISSGGATITGNTTVTGRGTIAEYNAGNVTGATGIDCANGNNQLITLTGSATLSFTNLTAGTVMILRLKQGGAGSYTVTWTGVTWAGGSAPTLTTTVGYSDVISLYYTGTALLGFIGALGFNA